MSALLHNKVAIVTASTAGIGFAIAKKLLVDGAKVVIGSRKEENVQNAVSQLAAAVEGCKERVEGCVFNVGQAEHRRQLVEQTVAKFGKIDILVSNAGTNPYFGPALGITENAWDKIFDVNVKSGFFLVKEAHPHLQKNASIIFVSSIAAYSPIPGLGPYSITKTALLGVVKTLATELGPEGIRVNGIAPGIIRTKFSRALHENDAVTDMVLMTTPLKRLGEAEECAGAVTFLASEDSRYITGEVISITGGMPARL